MSMSEFLDLIRTTLNDFTGLGLGLNQREK